MGNKFDLSKEYGLVLEGGGAKGAYQIGVWKALLEHGVKIKGVAGVSVGALNGALICMDDIERAEIIWRDIRYSKVMDVCDDMMENIVKGNLKELDIREMIKESIAILGNGGFNVAPLRKLLEEELDEEKIRNSPIEFVFGVFDVFKMKEIELEVKDVAEGMLAEYLLATAYFPVFKNEKINGRLYLDGGMLDNVPVDMLLKRGYKDIIVIRLYGMGREKRVKIPSDVNVYEVAPSVELGALLEFDANKSKKNMRIGYYDGLRLVQNLAGNWYYIHENEDELYYLNKLMEDAGREISMIGALYERKEKENEVCFRNVAECILPDLAMRLRLGKNWTYKEVYLALLEREVRKRKLPRYQIYTVEELERSVGY